MLEFKKILKRKDSKIMLALSLWPLILSMGFIFLSDVFTIESRGLIGAYDFVAQMISIQDLVFLPVLIIVYNASLTFYSEIDQKQIYMYKDNNRNKILNNKYFSVYGLYFIYLILYILISISSYYLVFRMSKYSSGTFFTTTEHIIPQLYESIQVIIGVLFYISVGIFFSIRYSSGVSIFATTLSYMLLKIAPYFKSVAYFIPTGYRDFSVNRIDEFWKYTLIALILMIIYNGFLYIINIKKFKSMEFK